MSGVIPYHYICRPPILWIAASIVGKIVFGNLITVLLMIIGPTLFDTDIGINFLAAMVLRMETTKWRPVHGVWIWRSV